MMEKMPFTGKPASRQDRRKCRFGRYVDSGMVLGTIKRALGGDYNEKELRKIRPIAEQVNEWTEEMADLSDADMLAKTDEFRGRLS